MNPSLVMVLLVLVAGSCIQAHRHPFRTNACSSALSLTSGGQLALQLATTTCIADQDGLQDIIDAITGGGGGLPLDVAALLEANGYEAEATTLRTCIATKLGLMTANGTFDMVAFKASITAMTSSTTVAANIQLGLDACPDVEEFDVQEYMDCIMSYCLTRAAPEKGQKQRWDFSAE